MHPAPCIPHPASRVPHPAPCTLHIGEYDVTGNQTRNYTNIVTETRGATSLTGDRSLFSGGTRHNGSRVIYLYGGANGPAPAAWQHWSAHTPGASGIETGDLDNDGNPDLLEYALGTDPSVSDAHRSPAILLQPGGGFAFEFLTPSQGRSDLTCHIEESSTLASGSWQPFAGTVLVEDLLDTRQRHTAPVATNEPRKFLRLRIRRD